MDDEVEYWSFDIVINSNLHSVHALENIREWQLNKLTSAVNKLLSKLNNCHCLVFMSLIEFFLF